MNRELLRNYVDAYKRNFPAINQKEIYKWKAVKCFQDNWNGDAENFHEVLMNSMHLTRNLLKSGQYFPLKMLLKCSEYRPQEIRNLFRDLYDEEKDLFDRIKDFNKRIGRINNELFPGKKSYQDHRAIIVYLTLRFPERYFFYKFEMFKQFSEKLNTFYKPIAGRIENIGHFHSQCELIRHELSLDQELLKLHKDRITSDCYYDENLNILTQDFIYSVVNHLNQIIVTQAVTAPSQTIVTSMSADELINSNDEFNFRGRMVNYMHNEIENRRIGYLGELWVIKYEIAKLTKLNRHDLIKEIKHTSKEEGDGTGYDIQSFNEKEDKIYIEVKTTRGEQNTTFFVTRNELEKSRIEKGNYYVYRVYNYDEQTGNADLLIIRGDLTNLCDFPTQYRITLAALQ